MLGGNSYQEDFIPATDLRLWLDATHSTQTYLNLMGFCDEQELWLPVSFLFDLIWKEIQQGKQQCYLFPIGRSRTTEIQPSTEMFLFDFLLLMKKNAKKYRSWATSSTNSSFDKDLIPTSG